MRPFGFVLVALAALGLGACATQPETNAYVHSESGDPTNVDKYYSEVYRNAERRGLLVQWVNPPTERDLDEYDFDLKKE